MEQLAWTLVGAVIGAVFSLLVYVAFEHLMLLKRPRGLFGVWASTWQPTVAPGWDWVTEQLKIRRRWGRVHLENANNSAGYEWKATAKVLGEKFLVGEWRSSKPGSQSSGAVVLTFGFDGDYMCGYFLRPDAATSKLASAFVIGRTAEDLERGKQRLKDARIRFPPA